MTGRLVVEAPLHRRRRQALALEATGQKLADALEASAATPPPPSSASLLSPSFSSSSLESETSIFACTFDQSGSRLITGEADKTIKIWKEDPDANPESHPVNWEAPRDRKRY